MSVAEITVEGLNRAAFFNKLSKAGVDIIKCAEKVDKNNKKTLLITVKTSDAAKVFAISKNMWYTKLKGYKGFFGLWKYFLKKLAACISCVAVFVAAFFAGNVCLKVDASSFPDRIAGKIINALEENDFRCPMFFHRTDFAKAERVILETVDEVKSVSVKREGMRLVVYGVSKPPRPAAYVKTEVLRSLYTGMLERLVVFSGEKLKEAGDEVVAGEIIAKNGVIAFYSVRCEFLFSRIGDGSEAFFEETKAAALLLYPNAEIKNEAKKSFGGKTEYILTLNVVFSYPNEE